MLMQPYGRFPLQAYPYRNIAKRSVNTRTILHVSLFPLNLQEHNKT
jgi:hypothetical protein